MSGRPPRLSALGLALAVAGCGTAAVPSASPSAVPSRASQPAATDTPSPTTTQLTASVKNIYSIPHFAPLEPGRYSIDADKDPLTTLHVLYTIPAEGWSQWIGGFKREAGSQRLVGVSIADVTNLVVNGCSDHAPADPPIGSQVDDLASALTRLAPFQVVDPPTDVTFAGYAGKHLSLILPEVAHELRSGQVYYTECTDGEIWSWKAPNISNAFYGYFGIGQLEEFWILDVAGSRLVIISESHPDSPTADVAEMHAVLASIKIVP